MTINKEALEKAREIYWQTDAVNDDCLARALESYLTSLPSAHGELAEAVNATLDWFDKANAPADEGCDFLNEGGWEEAPQIAATLRAAAATLREKEGWVLVPREPTKEMQIAGLAAFCNNVEMSQRKLPAAKTKSQTYMRIGQTMHSGHEINAAYKAMLSAAPTGGSHG